MGQTGYAVRIKDHESIDLVTFGISKNNRNIGFKVFRLSSCLKCKVFQICQQQFSQFNVDGF